MKTLALAVLLAGAQDGAKVADWIRDLGEESLDVRERAMEELVRMGRAAEKPLREALKSSNAEIRARAAEALGQIERREQARQFDAGPSFVSLRKEAAPLKEVLEEIQKQTPNRIRPNDLPDDLKATAAFDRVPFFQAVDDLARGHGGLRWTFEEEWEGAAGAAHTRDRVRSVVLTAGKYVEYPRAFAGQFFVRLSRVRMSTRKDFRGPERRSTDLHFEWGFEAGTRPVGALVRVSELKDDLGNSYAEDFKVDEEDVEFDESYLDTETYVSMSRLPQEGAKKFSLVQGRLEVVLPDAQEVFAFETPAEKQGTAVRTTAGEVRLVSFSRDKASARARVEVRPEALGERISIRVVARDGKEFSSHSMNGSGGDGVQTWDLKFGLPEGVEIKSLRAVALTGLLRKKVPFEFRDIRIR